MSLEREIKVLEEKLQEVDAWEKRVQELDVLLGIQEGVGEDEAKGEVAVGVEGDRGEEEEAALREMEEMEEEEGEASAAAAAEDLVVEPDTESSSASLVSLELDSMEASGVDLGVGLEELKMESQEAMVGVSEDGIVVVDVGFEGAVGEEELDMEMEEA